MKSWDILDPEGYAKRRMRERVRQFDMDAADEKLKRERSTS